MILANLILIAHNLDVKQRHSIPKRFGIFAIVWLVLMCLVLIFTLYITSELKILLGPDDVSAYTGHFYVQTPEEYPDDDRSSIQGM
jgi:hypothetical protein